MYVCIHLSIHIFHYQVERREVEIERLSSQLRGGRPPQALAMEGKIEGNERMVAHLNIQVCGTVHSNSYTQIGVAVC